MGRPTPAPTGSVNITRQFDDGVLQSHDPRATLEWHELLATLTDGGTFWLTTVGADHRPHT